MKKVRVLKEMPFVKVGDELDVNKHGYIYNEEHGHYTWHPDELIKYGWLEWVEGGKILEEKFFDHLRSTSFTMEYPDISVNTVARKMAEEAKEHCLGVFDKARNEARLSLNRGYDYVRNAIKEG